MNANLTPEYRRAEQQLREARTPADKLAALEEMLRTLPKHKGTDGMQADLRGRIAKLRKEPLKKGARSGFTHAVPREGAGQVALVGPPNSGRSSLVVALTHATPEVGRYPFTTLEATPGMMRFEDVLIQLVDLPPVSSQHVEPWVFDLVRVADLVWVVLDGDSPLEGLDEVRELLGRRKLALYPAGLAPAVADCPDGALQKRAVVLATGADRAGVREACRAADDLLEGRWPILPVSAVTGDGLDLLRQRTFEALDVIRIYSKQPGKPPDRAAPFTLPRGATVADLAVRIHKDLLAQMKSARVWGSGVFDGQTVQREHVLSDRDVVEIHE
jgi:uncharacterized protein